MMIVNSEYTFAHTFFNSDRVWHYAANSVLRIWDDRTLKMIKTEMDLSAVLN